MATQVIEILSDSLDERIKSNVETVTFYDPIFGRKMEIELGEANRKHLENHLERLTKYIDAAREVVEATPAKPASKNDLTAVREWARANGYTVGDRGRIKAEILEAYDAAQMASAEVSVVESIVEPAESEAEASVALDGDTQVIDQEATESVPDAEVGGYVNNLTGEAISEADFLALMEKASNENGEVTLDKLAEVAHQA
jgi:hypothetical protein